MMGILDFFGGSGGFGGILQLIIGGIIDFINAIIALLSGFGG